MSHEELYEQLLNRGFHGDFLDECSTDLMQSLVNRDWVAAGKAIDDEPRIKRPVHPRP